MSFFYDFLDSFKSHNLKEKPQIMLVFGVGVMIVGNVKLLISDENEMMIESDGFTIKICGENLKIKSLAKGEIVVEGNITSIYKDKAYAKWNLC